MRCCHGSLCLDVQPSKMPEHTVATNPLKLALDCSTSRLLRLQLVPEVVTKQPAKELDLKSRKAHSSTFSLFLFHLRLLLTAVFLPWHSRLVKALTGRLD